MILEKLKERARRHILSKQEGNCSPLLTASPCNYGILDKVWYEAYPFNFDFICWVYGRGRGFAIFRQDKYYEVTRYEFTKYLKQKSLRLAAMERFLKFSKICDRDYKKYNPDYLKKANNQSLKKIILSAVELCGTLQRDSLFSEALDEEISREFYLSLGGKAEDFGDFFFNSSLLVFDSFKIRRDKFILKILEHGGKINPYDIQWMYTDYYSAKKLEEAARLAKRIRPENIEKELAAADKLLKKNKFARRKFLNKINAKFKKLAHFIFLGMYIRDFRKDYFAKAQTIAYNAGVELFRRLGLNPRDCVYTFYTDFTTGLVNDSNFGKIINKRKKGFIVMTETKPTRHYLEVGNYEELKKNFMALHDKSNQEQKSGTIKGNVACKGRVKGQVKVVLYTKDFSKFKRGNILVASMTRPEFLPVIKKAAAIVTDEGGITCHAAIISRELNIPCIIGTRNATRILKDGDLVEVDADKGVVKILKTK